MKWLIGSFVFIVTFVTGMFVAGASYGGGLSNCTFNLPVTEAHAALQPLWPSRAPSDVMVIYAGLSYDLDAMVPRLKFVIVNGSAKQITYKAETPTSPRPRLTLNGTEIFSGSECQFRIPDFFMWPGESAEVYVYAHRFKNRPRSTDRMTVGFYLRPRLDDSGEYYTSEEFQLTEEFIAAIEPSSQQSAVSSQ